MATTASLRSALWFGGLEATTLPELLREQLDRRSSITAHRLMGHGLGPRDRVASFRHNTLADVVLWFACAKLGIVWVPVNASLGERDLAHVLEDAQPRMIVVGARLLDRYLRARRTGHVPELEVVGGSASPRSTGFLGEAEALAGHDVAPVDSAHVTASTPAAVTFTGGSTGMPKGVVLPQFAYVPAAMRYREMTEASDADTMVALGHLFHVRGQQIGLVGPMYCGMTAVLTEWFSASGYWDLLRRHRDRAIAVGGQGGAPAPVRRPVHRGVRRYVEVVADFPRSAAKQEILRYELRDRGIGHAWDAVPFRTEQKGRSA